MPELERRLVMLLRSLSAEDWDRPTVCPKWNVKDIAAHLLDTNLRKLSIGRDGYYGESGDIGNYKDLVAFLNKLNADWVSAARRLSPAVLINLIEMSTREVLDYYSTLDLHAPAAVAWAGEQESENWFDIARDYTERWHHQQQIRLATNNTNGPNAITERSLYFPVLDTFMRALPHHYGKVSAPEGATVTVVVSGAAGGEWSIRSRGSTWEPMLKPASPTAQVTLPEEIAWRVLTKGIDPETTRSLSSISGDAHYGEHFFSMVAVMA